MPVKRTAAAKKTAAKRGRPAKKTVAKSTPAKRGPGRPRKTAVKDVEKPASKRGGMHREVNDDTGFVVGTDQDTIALALLEGGESRAEIVDRLYETMDTETRTGTEKQIVNMVSGVLGRLQARGYTIESSFRVVPPTAASKRAATRAANAKNNVPAKKVAKKAVAKKTTAKTARGRRGK